MRRDKAHKAAVPARAWLPLLAVALARPAFAADISSYFDSAAGRKPRGDAGLVVTSDWMQLKADVALRTQSGSTEVVPNVRSLFDVGTRVDVETRLDLADRNGNAGAFAANTRVHYDPPPQCLEAIDGTVWRSPDGQAGEKLNIAFRKVVGAADRDGPITIRARAAIETTRLDAVPAVADAASPGEASHRIGLEAEIRGLLRGIVAGRSALRVKVDRFVGARVETVRSLAYDYSWTVRDVVQLGLNVGMQSTTQPASVASGPSLGLTWRARL